MHHACSHHSASADAALQKSNMELQYLVRSYYLYIVTDYLQTLIDYHLPGIESTQDLASYPVIRGLCCSYPRVYGQFTPFLCGCRPQRYYSKCFDLRVIFLSLHSPRSGQATCHSDLLWPQFFLWVCFWGIGLLSLAQMYKRPLLMRHILHHIWRIFLRSLVYGSFWATTDAKNFPLNLLLRYFTMRIGSTLNGLGLTLSACWISSPSGRRLLNHGLYPL